MNNWYNTLADNTVVLAEGIGFSLNCYQTQLNNNILGCAVSGGGKTRTLVTPNILQAVGSYVISDPKGNLYEKWKEYLEERGYEVVKVDFTNPTESVHYNPLQHAKTEYDLMKLAHQFVYCMVEKSQLSQSKDPFWDLMAELLLCAVIAYVSERGDSKKITLAEVCRLTTACGRKWGEGGKKESSFSNLIEAHKALHGNSLAVRMFEQMNVAPDRTYDCIVSTLVSAIGKYTLPELVRMMEYSDINFEDIGKKKMAIFVVVSDTDRTLDTLANMFFSQAMSELCRYADNECENNCLPVPVRFILDDFATNVKIADFPRMIASIRSRGISTMLMIQCESQLIAGYGEDGKTIIANCDTYVYMGTNEVESAEAIAKRSNVPLDEILYMPVGKSWIFRRGNRPIHAKCIDYDKFVAAKTKKEDREHE